jgi:cell wall-associated NlpC family hydrolase
MPIRLRLFTAVATASLALVPSAASAHHWHGPNGPQQDQPAQQGQPWDGPSAPDGSGWSPSQGDPQESPGTQPGPSTQQTPGPQHDNPWSSIPALPVSNTPTVAGKTAMIRRNGLAAVPDGAPASVRAIITAANQIIGKPYKWGGGHGRLFDSGYDCSGSVSYALIRAGLLGSPMVSGTLAHWGVNGVGRYVTIYANKSHVYMEVAGLRLDTSSVGDPAGKSGVRWRAPIGKRFGFAVRHIDGI